MLIFKLESARQQKRLCFFKYAFLLLVFKVFNIKYRISYLNISLLLHPAGHAR